MKTTYMEKGFRRSNLGGSDHNKGDKFHYVKFSADYKFHYEAKFIDGGYQVRVSENISKADGDRYLTVGLTEWEMKKNWTKWITIERLPEVFATANEAMDFINAKYFS